MRRMSRRNKQRINRRNVHLRVRILRKQQTPMRIRNRNRSSILHNPMPHNNHLRIHHFQPLSQSQPPKHLYSPPLHARKNKGFPKNCRHKRLLKRPRK